LSPNDIDGLVVCAADPRYQKAFRNFIEQDLGMQNPVVLAIPGGIGELVSPGAVKNARRLADQLKLLVKDARVNRIILINHADNQALHKLLGMWTSVLRIPVDKDLSIHVLELAEKLVEKYLGVSVECYLAKAEEDGTIQFFRLDHQ